MSEIKPTKMPAAVNGSVVSNDAGTILPMLCDINMPFYKKCLWKSQLSVICNHHDHFFPGLILNNVDREMIWNSSQFVSSFVLVELLQILSKLFIIFWNCSSREFRGPLICDVYLAKSCSLPLFCFKLGSTNPNYLNMNVGLKKFHKGGMWKKIWVRETKWGTKFFKEKGRTARRKILEKIELIFTNAYYFPVHFLIASYLIGGGFCRGT